MNLLYHQDVMNLIIISLNENPFQSLIVYEHYNCE